MKAATALIWMSLGFFCFLMGCTNTSSPAVTAGPEVPRLKITDLEPSDQKFVKIQCAFSVILYRVPLKNIQSIPKVFSMLTEKGLEFEDPDGFAANGFWAVRGTSAVGPEIVTALGKLEAERAGIKKLLLFQDYPEEIVGIPMENGGSVFRFRNDGTLAGQQVPSGRLSLRLKAKPDVPRKGVTEVEIEPLFKPAALMNLPSLKRDSLFQSLPFREGQFQTAMEEGDFILLAATRVQEESNTLSRLFLTTEHKQTEALLYLILCQKAGE